MVLSREEAELFFKLHSALMRFVEQQTKGAGVPGPSEPAAAYSSVPPDKRQEVVRGFLGRLDLIDRFITDNPAKLSEEELGIVSSWRHRRSGRFIALRQLKKHMILLAMTDAFCQARLNEEYGALCRKLAGKLAAKRPSPLLRGELRTWACGIIRTIGWVNFLGDRTRSPHMKLPEVDRAFGVAESTGQQKAKAIRRLLKIRQFDHRWTLPSRWQSTSSIWILQDSNGFIIDIRQQPVAMQRAAFERGLIPYVPQIGLRRCKNEFEAQRRAAYHAVRQ